jgi:hypothetical protein
MSLVFQNIDPPSPSPPGECPPPPPHNKGGGDTLAGRRRGEGGGSIFWKTRDIGLPSYSNNLCTSLRLLSVPAVTRTSMILFSGLGKNTPNLSI